MNHEQSEDDTREIWGENRENRRAGESGGEGGATSSSSGTGDLSLRVNRIIGEGGSIADLVGGIYSRLIAGAERRLGNAVACIEWYEREKQEALGDIATLRQQLGIIHSEEIVADQADESK